MFTQSASGKKETFKSESQHLLPATMDEKSILNQQYEPLEMAITEHVIKNAHEEMGMKLDQVIIPSCFAELKGDEQVKAILKEFNKNVKESSITESSVRGSRIPRDAFWLVHRNEIPEMVGWSEKYLALPIATWFGTTIEDLGVHPRNKPFFGAHGSYVLNVPPGKYALAWTKNKTVPLIYGSGQHVIHDPTFSFDAAVGFVDQTKPHIEHGYIHILQIPVGKVAKIWDAQNLMPAILPSRHEPYVFNSPYFKLDRTGNPENGPFENLAKDYIHHGNIHILRVPIGKVAKIWFGSNKVPMILPSRQEPYEFNCPYLEVETKGNPDNGLFDDAAKEYITHGSKHILRVPLGKIAAIWRGTKPEFLTSRPQPYEIDDPLFRLSRKSNEELFINALDQHISHGSKHILRIPPSKIAKVWYGSVPKFLTARPEPYEIDDPLFKLDRAANGDLFENETQECIQHGSKYIIRVPPGKLAKAWYGTTPKLLGYNEKPYEIDDPTFRLERAHADYLFEDQGTPYIKHGTKHILRVPTGKVAKISIGSEAELLEARKEAYEYDNPMFRLISANINELFEDAAAKLIEHGALKRIIPPVGEVAVLNATDEHGFPRIVKPSKTGEPFLVISSAISVKCWLPTTVQNLVFPSEKAKRNKLDERVSADLAKYEVFRTSDGADIGVKLYVSVMIEENDAALAARILKDEKNMLAHIEDVTQTDMRRAISQVSFQDITTGDLTRPRLREAEDQKQLQKTLQPSAPRRYIQDEMREQLAKDLKECGVTLVRLDILECEPLDVERVKKAKEASINTAQLSVEAATMETRYTIDIKKAKQAADVKRVEQEQTNESTYKQKEADLRAATAEANAVRAKAEGDAHAKFASAKAAADSYALEAKARIEAELMKAENEQKIALLKAQNEQQIALLRAKNEADAIGMKAEAEQKAALLRAETDAKAILLKAEAEQKSALLKIDSNKQDLSNQENAARIRVHAVVEEITGIAKAFAGNKEYADFKRAEAGTPALASALSKTNFNVLAGLNPQELMMAVLAMQSGMNFPMMTGQSGLINPATAMQPGGLNALSLFAKAMQPSNAATATKDTISTVAAKPAASLTNNS